MGRRLSRCGAADWFHEGKNLLAIHPDTDDGAESWVEFNREYSEKWPNITRIGKIPEDADKYKDETGKFDKYFSANPGAGT